MIHVKGLNKIHNENRGNAFQSLYDINMHVSEGELVVLQGVSGSGKSTLLSIIGALNKPSSGEAVVDGMAVAKLPDLHASAFRSSTIGFIFQAYNLFEELNVHDNVALPLIPLGLSQKLIEENTRRAMKLANIEHKAYQRSSDLSGGEKQRCAIARALVADAKIILCDEPTANLDRENTLIFTAILKDLKDMGKTIVNATHDPIFESLDFVDRILHIDQGRLVDP